MLTLSAFASHENNFAVDRLESLIKRLEKEINMIPDRADRSKAVEDAERSIAAIKAEQLRRENENAMRLAAQVENSIRPALSREIRNEIESMRENLKEFDGLYIKNEMSAAISKLTGAIKEELQRDISEVSQVFKTESKSAMHKSRESLYKRLTTLIAKQAERSRAELDSTVDHLRAELNNEASKLADISQELSGLQDSEHKLQESSSHSQSEAKKLEESLLDVKEEVSENIAELHKEREYIRQELDQARKAIEKAEELAGEAQKQSDKAAKEADKADKSAAHAEKMAEQADQASSTAVKELSTMAKAESILSQSVSQFASELSEAASNDLNEDRNSTSFQSNSSHNSTSESSSDSSSSRGNEMRFVEQSLRKSSDLGSQIRVVEALDQASSALRDAVEKLNGMQGIPKMHRESLQLSVTKPPPMANTSQVERSFIQMASFLPARIADRLSQRLRRLRNQRATRKNMQPSN